MADQNGVVKIKQKQLKTSENYYCRECKLSCKTSTKLASHLAKYHQKGYKDLNSIVRRSPRKNQQDLTLTVKKLRNKLSNPTENFVNSSKTLKPLVKLSTSQSNTFVNETFIGDNTDVNIAKVNQPEITTSVNDKPNQSELTKLDDQKNILVITPVISKDSTLLNTHEETANSQLTPKPEPKLDAIVEKIQTSPDSTSFDICESKTNMSSACIAINFDSNSHIKNNQAEMMLENGDNGDHYTDTNSVTSSSELLSPSQDSPEINKLSNDVSPTFAHDHSILADSGISTNPDLNNISNEENNDSDIDEYDSGFGKSSPIPLSGSIQPRNYVCIRCSFETTSAKEFLHHQIDCHRETFNIYECNMCEYATKYKQKLSRHYKTHFTSEHNDNSDTGSSLNDSDCNNDDLNDSMDEYSPTMVKSIHSSQTICSTNDSPLIEVSPPSITVTSTIPTMTPTPQRRNPRQEVDPGKYVIVNSEKGVKYACSKCTSVYSWRKSLNKHWKEKHPGEAPDMIERAKKMEELEETNGPTSFKSSENVHALSESDMSQYNNTFCYTPPASAFKRVGTPDSLSGPDELFKMVASMPNVIGPFITNSIFPPNFNKSATEAFARLQSHSNSHLSNLTKFAPDKMMNFSPQPALSALDLSNPKKTEFFRPEARSFLRQRPVTQVSEPEQTQPLDLTVKSPPSILKPQFNNLHSAFLYASHIAAASQFPFHIPVPATTIPKSEPLWNDDISKSPSPFDPDQSKITTDITPPRESTPNADGDLQCNRCPFKAKSLVDYSAHMSIHLSKRSYKCAECSDQFVGVDDLNSHFAINHAEKILEYKESMPKITNATNVTYPESKPNGSTPNFSQGPKNLKCTTCGFTAKWPAELQKHSVSHSEERPFVCMVCASTYKWKWDLVKHFEKSHHSLPNPYKRRDPVLAQLTNAMTGNNCGNGDSDGEQSSKKRKISDNNANFLVAKYLSSDVTESQKAEFIENLMNNNQEKDLDLSDNIVDASSYLPISTIHSNLPTNENNQKTVSDALRQKINQSHKTKEPNSPDSVDSKDQNDPSLTGMALPYCCPFCEYRARWPSEITQHMKNHSNEKPYRCPRCNYRSKWKWDVVKHLKRCGGGTVSDVIDTTKDVASLVIKDEPFKTGGFMTNRPSTPQLKYFNSLGLTKKEENIDNKDSIGKEKENGDGMTYNSIINDGTRHCLACPFKANSKADLNKHMTTHSENKPFACGSCGYCSRWKGDVKKHLKAYNHTGIIVNPKAKTGETNNVDQETNALKRKLISANGEEREMYKCDSCKFITSEKFSFIAHARSHKQANSENPKFKCKVCSHVASDLPGFLTHKLTHPTNAGIERDSAVSSLKTDSVNDFDDAPSNLDKADILRCDKCPFECCDETNFEVHKSMHQPRETACVTCSYCDYSVSTDNILQEHVQLHEKHMATESEFSQDMSPEQPDEDSIKCEWCDETFCHLYQLYEHADVKHPVQLHHQLLRRQAPVSTFDKS